MSQVKSRSSRNTPASSLDDLLSGGSSPLLPIEVPPLREGGKPTLVYMRPATVSEIVDFWKAAEEGESVQVNSTDKVSRLIQSTIVREDGTPFFADANGDLMTIGDIAEKLPFAVFKLLSTTIQEHLFDFDSDSSATADGEIGGLEKNDSSEGPKVKS